MTQLVIFIWTKLSVEENVLPWFIDGAFHSRHSPRKCCYDSVCHLWSTGLCAKDCIRYCYQIRSVTQLCPTLCDPMNRSTPGLPVHHQLLEFTQTHVQQVRDAIQPSHPLSSPSPLAPNPFQHQGLFQWVNSSHEVAKVLEFQLQHQSFQRTHRTDLLQNGLVGSPCSPRDSQESSPTSQFKREMKGKGKKERYIHWVASFKEYQREIRKPS